jgi:hypothetical protein
MLAIHEAPTAALPLAGEGAEQPSSPSFQDRREPSASEIHAGRH